MNGRRSEARCACGTPASHRTFRWWEESQESHQCCECYVREGNPPADWHPACMAAYELTSRGRSGVPLS